jgi:hypothetical protein
VTASSNFFQKRNAEKKRWRLIRERAAAKRLRDGISEPEETKTEKKKPPRVIVHPGDIFGLLTVVEQRPSDGNGNARALFRCSGGSPDCAKDFVMRVSNVRNNMKSGWCSCAPCYHAEGGAEIWKQQREPLAVKWARRPVPTVLPPPDEAELVKRIVAMIAGRHKGVKVTTTAELQTKLNEPRTALRRALRRAQTEGLIRCKRTRVANGYVLNKDDDIFS